MVFPQLCCDQFWTRLSVESNDAHVLLHDRIFGCEVLEIVSISAY
jgi:hypothetical protein